MMITISKNTDEDLGDDARLPEGPEKEDEGAGGDDHQGELQDEEWEGELEGVVPMPYPIRGYHRWRMAHHAILHQARHHLPRRRLLHLTQRPQSLPDLHHLHHHPNMRNCTQTNSKTLNKLLMSN